MREHIVIDGKCLSHAFSAMMNLYNENKPVKYVQGTVTNPADNKSFNGDLI